MENISLAISILAIIVSLWSVSAAIKYSRISVIHSLHEMMLQKAKDCNRLFEKTQVIEFRDTPLGGPPRPETVYQYIPTISEIIISIQLLNHSLNLYSQKNKRGFFLLQFWTQLSTPLREYFKLIEYQYNKYHETTQKQLQDIVKTFSPYFESY